MKIDGSGYLHVALDKSPRDETIKADFALAVARAQATGVEEATTKTGRADFRNMTRPALFDWMNARLKSGELSLDDSSGILAMANTQVIGEGGPTAGTAGRLNFYEVSRDAIENARLRNESGVERMFQTALRVMQTFQSSTDIRV